MGLSRHHAEATSLLVIVPVAIVGSYRHDRYGNVRRGAAPMLLVAAQLVHRTQSHGQDGEKS